jgi:hypothetical protein
LPKVQPDATKVEVGLIGPEGMSGTAVVCVGVRRAGVTEALQSLKRRKLIDTGRNQITILSRKGVERRTAGSYGVPKEEYRRLVGKARC